MANESLSQILQDMAFFAELKEENPFKVRALAKAAEILSEQPVEVAELIRTGEIKKIPGIGKGTQALAAEFVEKGTVGELEELSRSFPQRILELREVSGLGAKKIKALLAELGIGSLSELEYACEENRLAGIKGFGEKSQASILKSIKALRSFQGKIILPMALQDAEDVREELQALPGVKRVEATGELRRLDEVISSLDFLLEGDEKAVGKALEKDGFAKGPAGAWSKEGERAIPLKAWIAAKAEFGTRWLETTGPAAYVESLGKLPEAGEEVDVFAKKKKSFAPPETRDLGLAGGELIEEKDIKGVFHLHTTWSDGKNTLEEMAEAAVKLGLEYLGLSDHSQTAFYAHGLDEKRVLQQKKEIEKVQEKFPGLRIFHGIESDILPDGALDYPKSFLKNFDFVIASVHGQMKMNREDMTARICGALENPATTWLGHWTGRLLLGREAFDFDMEKVLKCAAKEGKSIELNANPYRLDVSWRHLPRLKELHIPVGIHPDAHSVGGLEDTRFGVWMARKAGYSRKDVLNTKTRKEMEAWLAERKP